MDIDKFLPEFDLKFYTSYYKDLSSMKRQPHKAWEHFKNHGYKEGRLINGKQLKEMQEEPEQIVEEIEKVTELNNIMANMQLNNNTQEIQENILVVMPTYNRSENITTSITYIKNQIYKNWTFLIIDDGSDINHKMRFNEIKEEYKADTQILFMENERNCHIAKTLNRGIKFLLNNEKSIFTHFTWISDDNKYYTNFLSDLILDNEYFKYASFDIQELNGRICTNRTSYKDYDDILNNFNGCASFMWTKSAIQEIGFYDENVPGCEDFEYLLRTFKLNESKCKFIDNSLMKYIRHSEALMEQKKDIIMNIKQQIVIDYKLKYVDTISYIKYPNYPYLKYYNNKTTEIANIITSLKNVNIEYVFQSGLVFDTNKLASFFDSDLSILYKYFTETKYNKIYILNELDYCHLKGFYQTNEKNKQIITNFFKKSTYLITFTEIFENDTLQTIGNTSYNKEYSILFFKYAYKVLVCDTKNLNFLYEYVNSLNILYNPPITTPDNMELIMSDKQDIDFLFYGALEDTIFKYRKNLIDIVNKFATTNGYVFKIFNRELFDDEKDNLLKRTKIVIHVGSLPNLRTLPWAKISELMIKKVFFLIENNLSEFNMHEMNISSYNITYNDENMQTNICELLEFYLSNPEKRYNSISRNTKYISRFNNTKMLQNIIKYNNIDKNVIKPQINKINKVIALNYGNKNFHSNLILQYKEFIENNGISFSYYDKKFTGIFGTYYGDYSIVNNAIFEKYIGCSEDYKENTYSFYNNKKIFNDFLLNYKQDNNILYVFGAEDIMAFFYYYDAANHDLIYNFINETKYIIFQCEVMTDSNLLTIGFSNCWMLTKYCQDFTMFERIKFLKGFYFKSQTIYICDTKNKYYLESNGIKNLKYFPPYINIPFKNFNRERTIDCLFYGYILPSYMDSYRNDFINKIKSNLNSEINFVVCENLYGDELIEKINDTKIVLHIPSHENLRTMPWAKIAYLMSNKIFFIIEENDEIYCKNLQDIIIYYKRNDIDDLKSKILYYKNKENQINIVKKCYEYYIEKFNQNILLKDLIV
jgi:hypothetical protein